jgi:DNA-binding transcriptional ArsR family regulator
MVEQALELDSVFQALANHYRRDILHRVSNHEQTAKNLASIYGLTIAAITKHFGVLERAGLIKTEKRGKERFAQLSTSGLMTATEWLHYYERFWNQQLDSLAQHLEVRNS